MELAGRLITLFVAFFIARFAISRNELGEVDLIDLEESKKILRLLHE